MIRQTGRKRSAKFSVSGAFPEHSCIANCKHFRSSVLWARFSSHPALCLKCWFRRVWNDIEYRWQRLRIVDSNELKLNPLRHGGENFSNNNEHRSVSAAKRRHILIRNRKSKQQMIISARSEGKLSPKLEWKWRRKETAKREQKIKTIKLEWNEISR